MSSETQRSIVIIGGGIIGCTTAYYLTRHPSFSPSTVVTVLEASKAGVAQGASGKAGGLVAKWAYPRELVDVSFAEHCKLAKEHDGTTRWGWRFVGVGSWEGRGQIPETVGSGVGTGGARRSLEKTTGLDELPLRSKSGGPGRRVHGLPDDLNWVREDLTSGYSPMAGEGDTAQVHPRQFTRAMLELAQERGVRLVAGRATAIEHSDGRVTGVKYVPTGGADPAAQTLPATDVLLAAGAWSPSLVPTLPIHATRAHSVTIRTQPDAVIAPYALFTEIAYPSEGRTTSVSPEIYARPDGELYACGPGDNSPLPATVDDVKCDDAACESVRAQVASISDELAAGEVTARQACFLPVVATGGGPVVGAAPQIARGLAIAAGHTCWGICNAPGTAKAVTELIMDGKVSCAKLTKLDPMKYLM